MLTIEPGQLQLAQLRQQFLQHQAIALSPTAQQAIQAAATTVQSIIDKQQTVYGINTGFGLLANTKIPNHELEQLQHNIVLSHAAGVGELLADEIVRLIMLLKINSLARGFSGIRPEVLDALIVLYNHEVYPCIPCQGSVGASGDLAPLAHMSMMLLGEGHVHLHSERITAKDALLHVGLKPIVLGPKEGLALLNGTQASTALALTALFKIENCLATAIVSGSLSVDACAGSDAPFDARIHALSGYRARDDIAALYRDLLQDSEIRHSHVDCDRVQDPYSLRCQPQVMGSCLHYLRFNAETLLTEANAVSDNPLVFSDSQTILSGGNFHAEAVAIAADNLAVCAAEIGSLSERRIALLTDKHLSGLPAFLVKNGGLNSGFMLAHVTAAALASENKTLAHPASVDSIPTSANQEDHVSMATFAARRLHMIVANVDNILAIELLAACQGIELRAPLKTSTPLQNILKQVRSVVAHYDQDRYFTDDIVAIQQMIEERKFMMSVGNLID